VYGKVGEVAAKLGEAPPAPAGAPSSAGSALVLRRHPMDYYPMPVVVRAPSAATSRKDADLRWGGTMHNENKTTAVVFVC
jgi:hypothetical protein